MTDIRKEAFTAVADKLPGIWGMAGTIPLMDRLVDIWEAKQGAEGRKIGLAGIALIKSFEGLELTAYRDAVGVLTIGYGSTGPHVKPGMKITEQEAEALLRKDLARFESAVDKLTGGNATQDQFDAMVSLAFNVGETNLAKSTLLKLHNAGDYVAAADQFARWNRAGGKVLNGLTRRRAAEANLYRGEA